MDRIVTERLILRRAREDDLDDVHAVLSHPVAMRYWSTLPHDQLDQTRAWLGDMIAADPAGNADYIVEFEGRVIGKAGCYQLPDIGYILHPDHWGRGLATEALGAIIPTVFARFPLDAITADVDPRNPASIRLLEKLGFTISGKAERTWQIGEEWCDSVYLTLPRPIT